MLQSQVAAPEVKPFPTIKLVTYGRVTGLPHVAELRYTYLDGSFFVFAGSSRSDWALNSLESRSAKVVVGEGAYQAAASEATTLDKERARESFRKRYGSRITDQWYKNANLCIRLIPSDWSSPQRADRGENGTRLDFRQWKDQNADYYQSVKEAFDSASEQYDFTISRNYINTWIRNRSIQELFKLTKPSDVLLEIGCGTGAEALQVSKCVAGIVATDISERMLEILEKKIRAKRLEGKISTARVAASSIGDVENVLPQGKVRIAYSFNGALNCEPEIRKVPEQLSRILEKGGYFVCSIRNTLCVSEALSHSLVFQFGKMATRKIQPTMVSVGGLDIPSFYYSPSRFVSLFRPFFRIRRMIGLPSFLPPAYLNKYFLQAGKARILLERLELLLGNRPPFNRVGDQTLFVFQRV